MKDINKPLAISSKNSLMSRKRSKLLLFIFCSLTLYCVFWMRSVKIEKQVDLKELLVRGIGLLESAGKEIVRIRSLPDLSQKVVYEIYYQSK